MNPTGPLPVGVADLSGTGVAPDVDRLAGRLFYPCQRSWTLPCTWIPHINYARGYIGMFQSINLLLRPDIWMSDSPTSRGYVFKMVAKKTWKTEMARSALISAAWALGSSMVLPVHYHAPAASPASAPGPFPVVVFSHGLAGTRNAYSSICIELASQGYVVLALEHSDGSASCARLPRLHPTGTAAGAAAAAAASPAAAAAAADGAARAPAAGECAAAVGATGSGGGSEWCFYGGLGDKPEQLRKTRHRVAEVAAAYGLLEGLNRGTLCTSGGSGGLVLRELPAAVADSLRGRLDMQRAVVAGHSYGGATAAAAAAALPYFRAAVSLDPWWDCFDEAWPVVNRWVNPHAAPLLVIGSDDWNTPNAEGKLKCGGGNQERVLAAAAAGGGGAVLAVPRGSTHTNFDDVMLLFGKSLSALLRLLGIRSSLEPRRAHQINMWCISHFLSRHLTPQQQPQPHQDLGQHQQQQQEEAPSADTDKTVDPDAAGGATAGAATAATTTTTTTTTTAAAAAAATSAASRPVRESDLEPYQEGVGEWLAILRLVAGREGGRRHTSDASFVQDLSPGPPAASLSSFTRIQRMHAGQGQGQGQGQSVIGPPPPGSGAASPRRAGSRGGSKVPSRNTSFRLSGMGGGGGGGGASPLAATLMHQQLLTALQQQQQQQQQGAGQRLIGVQQLMPAQGGGGGGGAAAAAAEAARNSAEEVISFVGDLEPTQSPQSASEPLLKIQPGGGGGGGGAATGAGGISSATMRRIHAPLKAASAGALPSVGGGAGGAAAATIVSSVAGSVSAGGISTTGSVGSPPLVFSPPAAASGATMYGGVASTTTTVDAAAAPTTAVGGSSPYAGLSWETRARLARLRTASQPELHDPSAGAAAAVDAITSAAPVSPEAVYSAVQSPGGEYGTVYGLRQTGSGGAPTPLHPLTSPIRTSAGSLAAAAAVTAAAAAGGGGGGGRLAPLQRRPSSVSELLDSLGLGHYSRSISGAVNGGLDELALLDDGGLRKAGLVSSRSRQLVRDELTRWGYK
ncbi:hypothetical protein PLESTF_001415400 [Pleodorina starrii]|nr:hypothetical protein PLESTF_001415400 [Pleodorina starrii]